MRIEQSMADPQQPVYRITRRAEAVRLMLGSSC